MAKIHVSLRVSSGSFGDVDVAAVNVEELIVEIPHATTTDALSSRDFAVLADRMARAIREAGSKMDQQLTDRADTADEKERERRRAEREQADTSGCV